MAEEIDTFDQGGDPAVGRRTKPSTFAIVAAVVLVYPLGLVLALAVGATWQMVSDTGSFPWNVLTPMAIVVTIAAGVIARRYGLKRKMSRLGALALGEFGATLVGVPLILLCFVGSTN